MPGERQPTLPRSRRRAAELLTRRRPRRRATPAERTRQRFAHAERRPAGAAAHRRRQADRRRRRPPLRRRDRSRRARGHDAVSMAATDEAISPRWPRDRAARPLPFAFAKRHGVLVRELTRGRGRGRLSRRRARRSAVAEVRRFICVAACSSSASTPSASTTLLREAYEGGSGAAMDADGRRLEDETDLADLAAGHARSRRTCSRARTRRRSSG